MKSIFAAIATAGLLFAGTAFAVENEAPDSAAAPDKSPGHEMQAQSSPGASEYAPGRSEKGASGASEASPGHQMQEETGPGASEQAPGHNKPQSSDPVESKGRGSKY